MARSSSWAASPRTAATPHASTPTRSPPTAGGGCPTCPSRSTTQRRRARTDASTSSAATAATALRSRLRSLLEAGSWRRLAPLPDARAAAAAAIAGGRLYVLGGVDGRRSLARIAFALDLRTGRWAQARRPRLLASISPQRPWARASSRSAAAAPASTRTRRASRATTRGRDGGRGSRRFRRRAAAPGATHVNGRIVSIGGEQPQGTIRSRLRLRASDEAAGAASPTSRLPGTASAWSRTPAASTRSPAGRSQGSPSAAQSSRYNPRAGR